jgi:hypothetical protein
VTPDPPFVKTREPTTVAFQTPNERRGHATVAVTVTPPPGVQMRPEAPPPGWSAVITGSGVRWSGGRITGTSSVPFAAKVTATTRTGSYAFDAVQRYDDGRIVRWQAAFTVLPGSSGGPDEHLGRAIVAGAAGLGVVAASLIGLHLLRRRRVPAGR